MEILIMVVASLLAGFVDAVSGTAIVLKLPDEFLKPWVSVNGSLKKSIFFTASTRQAGSATGKRRSLSLSKCPPWRNGL